MKVEFIGTDLVITIPADQSASKPSASGKSLRIVGTEGNLPTALLVNGKPVTVSVNAYIKA